MGNYLYYFQNEKYENENENENTNKYGWVRDSLDHRDVKLIYKKKHPNFNMKNNVDLRHLCPGIYNQGKLGSCTANAIAAAYEFNEIVDNEKNLFIPSRLFIYYNERQIENTVNNDSGAMIRDGIKSITKKGVCPETMWPYDIQKFKIKPNEECYKNALNHKCIQYKKLNQNLNQLKNALLFGKPFVFGFSVFESFESKEIAQTGVMSMPDKDDKLLGGHAVMCVGFSDSKEFFIIRNSWGENWGDKGYFYMPYEFITNKDLCSDFWIIEKIKDKNN